MTQERTPVPPVVEALLAYESGSRAPGPYRALADSLEQLTQMHAPLMLEDTFCVPLDLKMDMCGMTKEEKAVANIALLRKMADTGTIKNERRYEYLGRFLRTWVARLNARNS